MVKLVLQLALLILATRVVGLIFSRYLKQPKVLGELAAGMIIGPYALGRFVLPLLGEPLFPLPSTATCGYWASPALSVSMRVALPHPVPTT